MYLRAAEHRRGRQSGRRSANGPRSVSQYGKLLFELIEKIPKIPIKIGWHELSVCGGGVSGVVRKVVVREEGRLPGQEGGRECGESRSENARVQL